MINIGALKSQEDKKDEYTALVLLYQSVQSLANNKIGGWYLDYTYTNNDDQEFTTSYSNGKIKVTAHSVNGDHYYSVVSIEKEGK